MDFFCFRSDIEPKPPETTKNSRRESLGNFQQFLKTLTYWKRGSNSGNSDEKPQQAKVERSKSFSVKCDKGKILFSNGNELREGRKGLSEKKETNVDDRFDPNIQPGLKIHVPQKLQIFTAF